MIVINMWGAPSSGKSTTAAGLFFLMKINKMKVELINEYAKELVLEGRENIFGEQNYIFAEQNRRINRLKNHNYDFAITDSPLMLPVFYEIKNKNKFFPKFVVEEFKNHNNLNYLLKRNHSFEAIGRRHNEEESLKIAEELKEFMEKYDIKYMEVEASPKTPEIILEDIRKKLAPPIGMPFENLNDERLL